MFDLQFFVTNDQTAAASLLYLYFWQIVGCSLASLSNSALAADSLFNHPFCSAIAN